MDNVFLYARSFFKLINVCLYYFYSLKCFCCAGFLHSDDSWCSFKEDKLVFSDKTSQWQQLIFSYFCIWKEDVSQEWNAIIAISSRSFLLSTAVRCNLSFKHLTTLLLKTYSKFQRYSILALFAQRNRKQFYWK